jgi:glyoxylase-like metal-dependent hydrolase (beta-lactamase superfamily II)
MAAADLIGTDGVVPLRIGTPFLVGAVNVWLIEDEPLTIVDCGANTASALVELRDRLAERGHALQDVRRIVLTHGHHDHAGLAGPLAALTGAEVVALAGLDRLLATGTAAALAEERWCRALMRAHGVPAETVRGWWAARPDATGFASDAPGVIPVVDGDAITFAERTLHVHHRPGHSPSDVVLEDRERGVLIAGDHLLAGHAPVPMVSRPLPGVPAGTPDPAGLRVGADDAPRVSALLDLRASLRRTLALGADVALTGHGEPVGDVAANIALRLHEHDRAAEELLDELRRGGPATAHELVGRTAPGGRAHPYFGLCTTLGTLDQLVHEGVAGVAPDDGPPRYEAR